ncbi:hypothetical protein LCGC14_1644460 [marine sediment metagenome]|uniref:Uncharacterized protein n=1 Tax=marine sediment metagenome TaxID=412755 RepID=A0A0F9HYP1_9ZZZZ
MNEENDYYDIDTGFHVYPYCWECSKCKRNYKLRRTEDFKCECGQTLKFRFYKLKKEWVNN